MRMDRRKTSEEHVIDMHKLEDSITKWQNYAYANSKRSGKETALPLIPKIKRNIHDNQGSNNEPSIISIGPYYHRAPAVQSMQRMKYECLYFILSMNNENKLADYIKAMKGIEQHARSYYEDEINMETDEFLKMLLLDGCFVLVALLGFSDVVSATMEVSKVNFNMLQKESETSFAKTDDTIIDRDSNRVNPNQSIQNNIAHESNDQDGHTRMWYSHFLWNDALILDNQIPFCVLQRIHETFVGGKCSTLLLHKSAIKFMEHMIKCNQKAVRHFEEQMMFHHLLHLCHVYLSPTKGVSHQATQLDLASGSFNLIENQGKLKQNPWRRATEYHQAGIVLAKKEACDDSAHSLLDIVFCNGILHIPCLTIVHTITKCLLQNLLAFESSCPEFGNYITAYVLFWSTFISMPEDVELLTEKGIIEQQANSDAEVRSQHF